MPEVTDRIPTISDEVLGPANETLLFQDPLDGGFSYACLRPSSLNFTASLMPKIAESIMINYDMKHSQSFAERYGTGSAIYG